MKYAILYANLRDTILSTRIFVQYTSSEQSIINLPNKPLSRMFGVLNK
jgi:hypothetical protein